MIVTAHIVGGIFAAIGIAVTLSVIFNLASFKRGFITEKRRTPKIDK